MLELEGAVGRVSASWEVTPPTIPLRDLGSLDLESLALNRRELGRGTNFFRNGSFMPQARGCHRAGTNEPGTRGNAGRRGREIEADGRLWTDGWKVRGSNGATTRADAQPIASTTKDSKDVPTTLRIRLRPFAELIRPNILSSLLPLLFSLVTQPHAIPHHLISLRDAGHNTSPLRPSLSGRSFN